jgi:hypothetical protein
MRPTKGDALFYTRDSGGKHEMTPAEYVNWAINECNKGGLGFSGTGEQIERMIREGKSAEGDIYLDFDVKGNLLNRAGLDALKTRALSDLKVTHIFIPHRNRLARPNNPIDGVLLEQSLREVGLTLAFQDKVCDPIPKGRRQKLEDLLVSLLDYNYAGEYRTELARKILEAQIALARRGFSTGGRPLHGFDRWLVKDDCTPVRMLADGERVRMASHHVLWLPTNERKLEVNRRIIEMLKKTPACRVAAALTAEGIPSPDAGRRRKDNGVKHEVSGVWHQSTIMYIARNPLLVAIASFGRRSMGDQMRFSPDGPRHLDEAVDFREDKGCKVILNPESKQIQTVRNFEPLMSQDERRELLQVLDERAGSQRNKPRAHNPAKNPLGCRVFDMNCTWPMYRQPYGGSFRYTCGLYQQSHGAQCDHNHIDGPLATRFVLDCLRQRLLSPSLLPKLKQKLRDLAGQNRCKTQIIETKTATRTALEQVRGEIKRAERNLALATSQENFRAIEAVIAELREREKALAAELKSAEPRSAFGSDTEAEIEAALAFANRLSELASNGENFALAREAFELANAKLFVAFKPIPKKRRTVNQISGGILTLGTAQPPVVQYAGPTSRKQINKRKPGAANAIPGNGGRRSPAESEPQSSDGEEMSLGNVNRGDRI